MLFSLLLFIKGIPSLSSGPLGNCNGCGLAGGLAGALAGGLADGFAGGLADGLTGRLTRGLGCNLETFIFNSLCILVKLFAILLFSKILYESLCIFLAFFIINIILRLLYYFNNNGRVYPEIAITNNPHAII